MAEACTIKSKKGISLKDVLSQKDSFDAVTFFLHRTKKQRICAPSKKKRPQLVLYETAALTTGEGEKKEALLGSGEIEEVGPCMLTAQQKRS